MKRVKIIFFVCIALLVSGALFAAQKKIVAGDQLSIWVKGEPDLSVAQVVARDGSINMPLIGSVGVTGLSTGGAARVIVEMLEDGYLRDPLVQVTIKNKKKKNSKYVAKASPLQAGRYNSTPIKNVSNMNSSQRIQVIDSETGKGVNGVALFMGSRIYQSNRLGQIDLKSSTGKIILIADGYQIISGDFQGSLKSGNPSQIVLNRVKLAESITFHVIDAYTKRPIRGVEVVLDSMKIKTNSKGTFKIKLIKREFGEISLRKKGYKHQKQVVDFKGPVTRLILLMRN